MLRSKEIKLMILRSTQINQEVWTKMILTDNKKGYHIEQKNNEVVSLTNTICLLVNEATVAVLIAGRVVVMKLAY